MPRQTFLNLDSTKRQAIVDAAIAEFACHPFEQASLSRIVDNCGIAKGSMYQYFQDKLDLYLYIVDLAYAEKRAYVAKAFALEAGIFAVLEEYYYQSYLFAQDFPLLHRVAKHFWDSRVLVEQIEQNRIARESDFFEFLEEAIASGIINSALDPQAVFVVYHAVGKELIEQFAKDTDHQVIRQILDVLRFGLEVRKGD